MKTFNVNGIQIKAKDKFDAIKKYKQYSTIVDGLKKISRFTKNDEGKTFILAKPFEYYDIDLGEVEIPAGTKMKVISYNGGGGGYPLLKFGNDKPDVFTLEEPIYVRDSVNDSTIVDGPAGNQIATKCDNFYLKLHSIFSEMFNTLDLIEACKDENSEEVWQNFYEAHDNLDRCLTRLRDASRLAKKMKDSVNDGTMSEIQSGEYKDGFLRVMTKSEYEKAKRNGRLAVTGSLFNSVDKAKEYIQFLKSDETYVIVNMINDKVIEVK